MAEHDDMANEGKLRGDARQPEGGAALSEQAGTESKSSLTIFIKEARGHQERFQKLIQFTNSSTKAAGAMLLAAIVALVIANSGVSGPFIEFWRTEVGFAFGGSIVVDMSLGHIINDLFMALFFLLVGLEIKYEMTVGELTNIRQAILPIVAACGGVLAPIAIYLIFNAGNPATMNGWGVPTATDIAFALGIISLLGTRVPSGVRVFLSTLAVADDIIAILVIAVFYGHSPSLFWLACAAAVFVVLVLMNKTHVYALTAYMVVGLVLWYCVFMSGVHATIAGVLLAFTIPSGSRVNLRSFTDWAGKRTRAAASSFDASVPVLGQEDYLKNVAALRTVSKQVIPPATRLEHMLYPWVYFAVLPLFALTNADVAFGGTDLATLLANPVTMGVFFGLLLGKPIGIMLFSFVIVKSKVASLPENVNWLHMLGASILGGVGFTMAIFVANLAYADEMLIASAKLGILSASLLAGVVGFVLLLLQARAAQKRGVKFSSIEDAAVPASSGVAADAVAEHPVVHVDGSRVREAVAATVGTLGLRQEMEIALNNLGADEKQREALKDAVSDLMSDPDSVGAFEAVSEAMRAVGISVDMPQEDDAVKKSDDVRG